MKLSIIVPTYNEEDNIAEQLKYLQKHSKDFDSEIIVVDGQSKDGTVAKARDCCTTCVVCENKGRAAQMNAGVDCSTGDILYFVHADSTPPKSFVSDIYKALEEGYEAGCYRFKFDSDHPLLKINAFMTRFDRIMCRGGDQTLFIKRSVFKELGGYKDHFMIMEDYDLIERIQETSSFKIIPKNVTVSSRKYHHNGYFKVQVANFIVFMMYFMNCPQEKMVNAYKKLLYHPKL